MNYKKDLISMYAKEKGIPFAEAFKDVNTFLECTASLITQDGLSIKGLFTIRKSVRKGRSGIINGTPYNSKDKVTLKLSVGSELDTELNG